MMVATSFNVFPVRVRYNEAKGKKEKAPAIPKGESWREYQATEKEFAKTANIGITIPAGVVVLDLDTHKGITTDDVDHLFGIELDWEDAALQRTTSGGMHYAFRIDVDVLRQDTNALGLKGFDTRISGKGWIASGEGYDDLTLIGLRETFAEGIDDLPLLPDDCVNLLNDGAEADDDDDALSVVIAQEPLGYDNGQIEAILAKLDDSVVEDGDQWLRVGMGVYHETAGSEAGWQLFDEWSKRSESNYDKRSNRARWDSFGSTEMSRPTTFKSVIKMAGGVETVVEVHAEDLREVVSTCGSVKELNEAMGKIAESNLKNLRLDLILKQVQRQHKVITNETLSLATAKRTIKQLRSKLRKRVKGDFIEDFVFVTTTGEYMNRTNKCCMGPRSFNTRFTRETPLNVEGEEITATNFSESQIACVDSTIYMPTCDDFFEMDGVSYFNTYRPTLLEPVPMGTTDIVDRILAHIAHLLPDKREQEILINYLAHNVQKPADKLHWAVVLQGVQGDGKSFIGEVMQHLMGFHNTKQISVDTLHTNFTSWAGGHCFGIIEELKLDNMTKYEIVNKLKPYITNPIVEVTHKGVDPVSVPNTVNYIAFTNYRDAIPLDDNDRRWCVLFSQWQSKEKLEAWLADNPDYYAKLYHDMRENAGELLDWLQSYEIAGWFRNLVRAPHTNAKAAMVEVSKSEAWLAVDDMIAAHEAHDISDQVFDVTKAGWLAKQFGYDDFPKTRALKNVLLDMGYAAIGRYKDDDRKNRTIYCKDPDAKPADFKQSDHVNFDPL